MELIGFPQTPDRRSLANHLMLHQNENSFVVSDKEKRECKMGFIGQWFIRSFYYISD
jgi:hypothetical protein